MKLVFKILVLYVVFLIQTLITQPQVDLVLLILVIFALHDTQADALILGAWAGILLGLTNPMHFGFHIALMTAIAFASNHIRRFIYKYISYFIGIILIAILFKYLIFLIFLGAQQSFLYWLLGTLIVLVIAIPLENLIVKLFYPTPVFER